MLNTLTLIPVPVQEDPGLKLRSPQARSSTLHTAPVGGGFRVCLQDPCIVKFSMGFDMWSVSRMLHYRGYGTQGSPNTPLLPK